MKDSAGGGVSDRERQSHQLAADLAEQLGVPVKFVYHDEPARRGIGAGRVYWADGPTPSVMRAEIARQAERYPAVDVERLAFSRSATDLARVAAMLVRLPRQPEQTGDIDMAVVDSAFDAVDFPERLGDVLLRRAQALLQLEGSLSVTVVRLLCARAAPGWEYAERWLDELIAAADDSRTDGRVADLTAARARRGRRRRPDRPS